MNKQERDRIRKTAEVNWEQIIALLDHIDALEGRIEELQIDSDNYRWSIKSGKDAVSEPILRMWAKVGQDGRLYPTEEEWHSAITKGRKAALTQAEESV